MIILNLTTYFKIFALSAFSNFLLIKFFNKFNFFQPVREEILDIRKHNSTPTFGGIAIFFSLICFAWNLDLSIFLLGLSFAFLGFVDDYLKLKNKKYHGLKRNYKLFFEILFSALFVGYIIFQDPSRNFIPILSLFFTLKFLSLIWGVWIIISAANSFNLTDGVDSLSSSLAIYVFLFLFFTTKNILALGMISAILGFLIFNKPVAKIYMGDTGSLGIGAIIGAMFYKEKIELWLILVGIIFVVETVSVILQIYYIKKLKKKLFRMAPLHHHFEKLGWSQNKILLVFNLVAILAMVIGVLGL